MSRIFLKWRSSSKRQGMPMLPNGPSLLAKTVPSASAMANHGMPLFPSGWNFLIHNQAPGRGRRGRRHRV